MAGDYLKRVERVRIKVDFMKKTAGQRSGNFSDSNSPCLKKLCSAKLPQFHDMLNEICFLATFSNYGERPNSFSIFYTRNGVSISHDMQYSTFYVSICCKEIYKKICVNNIKFGACRLYL